MAGQFAILGTLTIVNGATDSGILVPKTKGFGYLSTLIVYCPATLPETITMQVDPYEANQTWYTLQDNGADVAFAAGKAVVVFTGAFQSMRLHAGVAVAADRVFVVTGQLDLAT